MIIKSRTFNEIEKEVSDYKIRHIVFFKLFLYGISRSFRHLYYKMKLPKRALKELPTGSRFLHNEGGMFKLYVYWKCNKYKKIAGSCILVPGCGYGKNIYTLASFRPKKIVCFDLSGYKEEWQFLREKILNDFGVEVEFIKTNVDKLLPQHKEYFEIIISDAVLEHITNLDVFLRKCSDLLKPNGLFYASFGPLWFGPGGDHMDWTSCGSEGMFYHLLKSKTEYKKLLKERIGNASLYNSNDGYFLIKHGLFSFLTLNKYYFKIKSSKFRLIENYIKVSSNACCLLENNNILSKKLNKLAVPILDRYCLGALVWARKEYL